MQFMEDARRILQQVRDGVTRLARKNVPERVAMQFVGHASATVRRIY